MRSPSVRCQGCPGMMSALRQHGLSMSLAVDAIDRMGDISDRVRFGCVPALAIWISPRPRPVTDVAGVH